MLRITMTFPPRDMEKLGSLSVAFAKELFIDKVVEGPSFISFNVENSKRLDSWIESWIRVIRNDAPYGAFTIEKVPDEPDPATDPRQLAQADAGRSAD
jgi:hypothetical protein